jgi:spore coat protein U-like protein
MALLHCLTYSQARSNSNRISANVETTRLGSARRHKFVLTTIGFLVSLALGPPAVAATANTTFAVTATVGATCSISAVPLAFGAYTQAIAQATSTITVNCTDTTPYNVGLDAGLTIGATVLTRAMSTVGGSLPYTLFTDAARTINWGNTVGTDTQAGTGNGGPQGLTVYGQVGAGQLVVPGTYTDTITATISY